MPISTSAGSYLLSNVSINIVTGRGFIFVVQLFTLANPLLIQVIIDKVISQRSLDTLQVLGVALVAVTFLREC